MYIFVALSYLPPVLILLHSLLHPLYAGDRGAGGSEGRDGRKGDQYDGRGSPRSGEAGTHKAKDRVYTNGRTNWSGKLNNVLMCKHTNLTIV